MRIYCAVRHSHDPALYYGGLWSANFYPALRRLGHEIVESQVDLLPASGFMQVPDGFTPEELAVRAEITQRIVDEVQAAHARQPIDLFLSYFYNAHFDPDGFEAIHRLGIPTVNFYCNSIYQFELVEAIAKKVLWSWHPEQPARDAYLAAGARPVWVQMGADPELYRSLPGSARSPRACFVGQRYADRDRLVRALVRADLAVDVYGSGWGSAAKAPAPCMQDVREPGPISGRAATAGSYLGRPCFSAGGWKSYVSVTRQNLRHDGLFGGLLRTALQWKYRRNSRTISPQIGSAIRGVATDLCETFSRYEVVLNFSNVWADGRPGSRLIPHVRLRDFEAPMCRTCYLTGHTDEIAEFYEPGCEIETYRTEEELTEKTRFYLTHPAAAEKLRESGHRRAVRDHTWARRFEQLFRETGCTQLEVVR